MPHLDAVIMDSTLELPARFDTAEAVALWNRIVRSEAMPGFDASAVTHLGVAGLQVLVRTAALFESRGGRLVLQSPSSGLRDGAALMGAGALVAGWERP